jgi:voltage-gated sodium channel
MIKRFFLSERNMMAAIILNSLIIIMLYFPRFEGDEYLTFIEHSFVILFLIEAIVKIAIFKPRKYFSNNWNRFDFIIVIISLPSLFMSILPLPDASALLLLRVIRLVRLFRLMQFVPHLTMILSGLGRALKASVFVLLVLLFLDLVIAIFACHFYRETAPEYFGDPLISAHTVFQLFTIEGWNEVSDAIVDSTKGEYYQGFSRFFFVLIVLFGGIFGMSLANAVFVDEMTMDNNRELEDKIDSLQAEVTKIRELLEKRDVE